MRGPPAVARWFGAIGSDFFGIPIAFGWTAAGGTRALAEVTVRAGVLLTNILAASGDGKLSIGSAYGVASNPRTFELRLP